MYNITELILQNAAIDQSESSITKQYVNTITAYKISYKKGLISPDRQKFMVLSWNNNDTNLM